MTYTNQSQLIAQFGEDELIQLTDRPDPDTGDITGAIVDAVLDAAINAAAKRIDGYISPRYALPLDQSIIDASSLPEMAGYIVRKVLYDDAPTEIVKEDYKDAIAWLRDVQAGKVSLGEQDTGAADTGRTVVRAGVSAFNWDAY